ncbi:MATE family efflux transporter [Candidatus Soleaferrea massiliensis]|uniref:MATE family efflux transporter n=1 Tax=Candidatus Soleaferrea massiliensis TaxID=1470354 RepID=UPI00058D82E0|nr:MATE family efflux transporter [Candidatus Soleaferrea massiliensis]
MDKSLDRSISPGMLIKFSLPTVISMVFMGIYSSVDGIFVSRLVGTDALSAVNIVIPLIMTILAIGFMLGTGGNALVAKKMGEGKTNEARQNLTLLVVAAFVVSAVITVLGSVFIEPLLRLLGANSDIYTLCYEYTQPLFILIPFALLGILFQQFFITEGRPNLGMLSSVLGGIANIGLDYLLIAVFDMGVTGAALATGIGYSIPALVGIVYFACSRKRGLYFVKPKLDVPVIIKSCTNGVSEMISMLASSVTMLVINNILIRLAGSNGVAAISIILIAQGILTSIYMGYSSGIAPIISFNYGKQDTDRLKKIYSISLSIIFAVSVISLAAGLVFTKPLVGIFTNAGTEVYEMAVHGFRITCIGFLFMGFNGFSSSMFTALNNGRVSGILSFFRTLVFVLITTLTLPFIFGVTGVWIAIPLAEILAIFMTIYYFKKMKPIYKYA